MFYLNTPFNFEARLAVKRGNKIMTTRIAGGLLLGYNP